MPKSVLDNNRTKKGADRSHQMSSYYTALKKNNKWYKKIPFEIITASAMVNAWMLFKKYFVVGNQWPMLKFFESIILSLLTTIQIEIVKPGRCPLVTNVHSNSSTH